MDKELKTAVLKTLAYSDIFDYPLRISEIKQYLIGFQLDDPSTLSLLFTDYHGNTDYHGGKNGLSRKKLTQIGERNGYFFLQGREKIVPLRQKREKISQEKIQRAKEILGILKVVPFIKMAAVTGAAAAGNADEKSDIDVLIVTQKKRMWLARMLAILVLEIKRVRRRPDPPSSRRTAGLQKVYKDKICLNMFVSEENLELPHKDLFTANEFVRMKVIWEKENTYKKFVKANGWVRKYLPNWKPELKITKHQAPNSKHIQSTKFQISTKFKAPSSKFFDILGLRFVIYLLFGILNLVLDCVEKCVRIVQLKYMERRKTTELVTDTLLMFHPNDAREWVMRKYRKRIKELGVSA